MDGITNKIKKIWCTTCERMTVHQNIYGSWECMEHPEDSDVRDHEG